MPTCRLAPFLLAGGLALAGPGVLAADLAVDLRTVWSDNASNGERPEDILSGLRGEIDLALPFARALGRGHRLEGSLGLRGEWWPEFEGLNTLAPRLAGGWSYKPGLGPFRPVFFVRGHGEGVLASERARAGWTGNVRVGVDRRILPSLQLQFGREWQRMDARGRAFDRTAAEWVAELRWDLGPVWRVQLEARQRAGDVVSYSAPPRPDLEAIGKPITYVETFEQGIPWIAYYFFAETDIGALTVARTHADGRTSTALRVEERRTRHAGPGYRNRLLALSTSLAF